MTEDKNMIKIQALEEAQNILMHRADMLHNACFSEEAMNIYHQCYGERFIRLSEARNKVTLKSNHLYDAIYTISQQILNLCMEEQN